MTEHESGAQRPQKQFSGEQGGKGEGGSNGSGGGGRRRKRYFRNRRKGRKSQSENVEARSENRSEGRSDNRSRGDGRNEGRGAKGSPDAKLDDTKRARRDRRRRKRSKEQRADSAVTSVAPEPMLDLNIQPKQVSVYTHVLRPILRDAYEYRAEHFSAGGRRLEDFNIDLSSILVYPEDEETGEQAAEPVIQLRIGGEPGSNDSLDTDWDDDEPFGDEPL